MSDPDGYYAILGLEPGSSVEKIKKAYSKMQMKYNLDCGSLSRQYKQIVDEKERASKMAELQEMNYKLNNAREFLSDENNKKLYDGGMSEADIKQGGAAGFNSDMFSGHDIFDMFSGFFENRGKGRASKKTEPVCIDAELTFREVFSGKVFYKDFKREVCCTYCKGKGGENCSTCSTCKGRGRCTYHKRIGSAINITEGLCRDCQGKGEIVKGPLCNSCSGSKVVHKMHKVRIDIPRGVNHGEKIVLQGEGNHLPNKEPGDVVVTCLVQDHDTFTRVGNDLLCEMEVDLFQALVGTVLKFTTIDNRKIEIAIRPVLDLEKALIVPNEGFRGLHKTNRTETVGNLVIKPKYKIPAMNLQDFARKMQLQPPSLVDQMLNQKSTCVEAISVDYEEPQQQQEEQSSRRSTFHEVFENGFFGGSGTTFSFF